MPAYDASFADAAAAALMLAATPIIFFVAYAVISPRHIFAALRALRHIR